MAITGVVLFDGPSMLDGEPIVAIATFDSLNRKTGNVIQTWILRKDVSPTVAVKTGQDSSICGKCPHRHFSGGGCYVLPFQAPLNIWKHYQQGNYPKMAPKYIPKFINRGLRLGSYGDPAAVPYTIWLAITSICSVRTGFTHQIEHECFDQNILKLCQVSIETPSQYKKYAQYGTFRVKTEEMPLLEGEQLCRNTQGYRCEQCHLCDGKSKSKIAINFHGQRKANFENKFGV
ncbi:MAG: hypothetical protein JKY54_10860 [Flavobacteriales bacterium]|nr:hypothetical protein [Flavobacteriales bacterium]